MGTSISRAVVAILLLGTAACQRPTQSLPLGPQFEMEQDGGDDATSTKMPAADDTLALVDSGGVVPGSVEDFLRFVGTDKVFFTYDSAELSPVARETLDRQAEWLAKYPNVSVTLAGHSDERGTREYNFALGERRSAAMSFHLKAQGIPVERIATTSFGKERPMVAGSDEQSWSQNRRGETVLIGAVSRN